MRVRKDIIEYNNKLKTKKLLTKINTGIALFTAGFALSKVSDVNLWEPKTVCAQTRTTPSKFLGLVAESARSIAAKNDLYASVMIAQAALESGWGNSTLAQSPNYNLFGIKGTYNGNSINVDTLEDDGSGNYYQINDGFRKYDNYGQSLQDYASVLTGDDDPNSWRYKHYAGARLSNTSSYQEATAHLTGRYATDTSYGEKLNRIIEQHNLTQYDSSSSVNSNSPVFSVVNNSSSASSSVDTVRAGEGLYSVARRNGISLGTLLANNGLTENSVIHPGQKLIIGQSANQPVYSAGTSTEYNYTSSNQVAETETSTATISYDGSTYSVKPGEGLYRIAVNHGMTLAELKALNGLTSDSIYPGQILKVSGSYSGSASSEIYSQPEVEVSYEIPATSETEYYEIPVTAEADYTVESAEVASGSYVVQTGDTLYSISKRFGLDVNQLIAQNGSTSILPGQVINY